MAARRGYPMTPAVRFLEKIAVPFIPHLYPYEEKGGTRQAAACLHIAEHNIIKTLVLEKDDKRPLIMLMHGDRQVSTKKLARQLGVKQITPCDPVTARRHTGYAVGGISPFGHSLALPVFAESSIFMLDKLYINGGKRGFLVEITPAHLIKALNPTQVNAAAVS